MGKAAKRGTVLNGARSEASPPASDGQPSAEKYHELMKALEFEHLISDLLTEFLKISAEQVDSEIKMSIQRISEFLGLDRGSLAQLSTCGTHMVCTHQWAAPHACLLSIPPASLPAPWVSRQILLGRDVAFSRVEDLPDEAKKDKEFFSSIGTKSHISLPLNVGGQVIGNMSLESVKNEMHWPDELTCRLKTVADIFAGAVKRKRRKLEFMERLRFETLLTDLSARFVSIDTSEIDREIESALEQIGVLFHGDRCAILEVNPDMKSVRVTHAWYGKGIDRVSGETNLAPLFPWSFDKHVADGQCISFSSLAELPPEAEKDRRSFDSMGVRSSLAIPLFIGKDVRHLIVFQNMHKGRVWPHEYIPRLRLLGETFVNALIRKDTEEKMRLSCQEIRALKDRLQVEAEFLRSEIKLSKPHEEIIGQSESLSRVLALVEQVAPTESTVLICGETGTGKELIARAIHNLSPHREKLMVKVNCASLPSALVESELFGREKGAYTGALTRQIGRFELADGSTIFLDEIAEISLELQSKLLRVLQEGQFERLGSPKTIQVRVRVIAATNRNLEEEVIKGNFRNDLYYRLNVFPIVVPPLRERLDDIPMLVWTFVRDFCEKMGKQIQKIPKRDMEALQHYRWPGNIRELRNVIEHAVIVSKGDTLHVQLPENAREEISGVMTLEEVECQHIMDVLRSTGWRIKGEGGAAQILGLNPSTLYSRMQKLGITIRTEKGEISS
jgi:formate hydrogenlyase transcriptional activator